MQRQSSFKSTSTAMAIISNTRFSSELPFITFFVAWNRATKSFSDIGPSASGASFAADPPILACSVSIRCRKGSLALAMLFFDELLLPSGLLLRGLLGLSGLSMTPADCLRVGLARPLTGLAESECWLWCSGSALQWAQYLLWRCRLIGR